MESCNGTPTDLDRNRYGYDWNSNRFWKQSMVVTAVVFVFASPDSTAPSDCLSACTTVLPEGNVPSILQERLLSRRIGAQFSPRFA